MDVPAEVNLFLPPVYFVESLGNPRDEHAWVFSFGINDGEEAGKTTPLCFRIFLAPFGVFFVLEGHATKMESSRPGEIKGGIWIVKRGEREGARERFRISEGGRFSPLYLFRSPRNLWRS